MLCYFHTDYGYEPDFFHKHLYETIITDNRSLLKPGEQEIWDMIQEKPDRYTVGNVVGYPESLFEDKDWKELDEHGLSVRFGTNVELTEDEIALSDSFLEAIADDDDELFKEGCRKIIEFGKQRYQREKNMKEAINWIENLGKDNKEGEGKNE